MPRLLMGVSVLLPGALLQGAVLLSVEAHYHVPIDSHMYSHH